MRFCRSLALLGTLGFTLMATGQTTQPASAEPVAQPTTTQPADAQAVNALVLEVTGDVQAAPPGSDEFAAIEVDDELAPETTIRTGIRSRVKLRMGTDDTHTLVVIEPATQTLIARAFRTDTTKSVKLDLGYGQVRAGVVEGGLESDFVVESPVATLSKRGTWDFGMFYERMTDRFEVFVHDQGLVDALNRATRQRRELFAGQYVNQAMRRWADESQLRFNVPVPDILGQSELKVAFSRLRQDGLRVIDPLGGQSVLLDLSSSFSRGQFANLAQQGLIGTPVPQSGLRPEGLFGTGRGEDLIPIVVDKDAQIVRRGFARPGTYHFKRAVLQAWLKKQRR